MDQAHVPDEPVFAATRAGPARPLHRLLALPAAGDGHRHLLLFRFLLTNLLALALIGAAWLEGWIGLVIAGDQTRLVAIIALVFAAGLAECARRVIETSRELDAVRDPASLPSRRVRQYLELSSGREPQSRALLASALKLKLAARIASVRHAANSLVFLGLIGTVIGFIIALSGIEPDTAASVESVGPMVSTLIGGMSVALYTTLVGSILNIWLMSNYRLLEGGTVRLLTAIVERGERHG